jgi:hypothetical protein
MIIIADSHAEIAANQVLLGLQIADIIGRLYPIDRLPIVQAHIMRNRRALNKHQTGLF